MGIKYIFLPNYVELSARLFWFIIIQPIINNKNYKFNVAYPSPKTRFAKTLSPKDKALRTRRKRKLDRLVDSIMRGLTDHPSFDLRAKIPPLIDRQRSAGGFTCELF